MNPFATALLAADRTRELLDQGGTLDGTTLDGTTLDGTTRTAAELKRYADEESRGGVRPWTSGPRGGRYRSRSSSSRTPAKP